MEPMRSAARTELVQLKPIRIIPSVLLAVIRPFAALRARELDELTNVSPLFCHVRSLSDAGDDPSAHSPSTLANREAKTRLHGHRIYQLDMHLRVVARHDHFDAIG